MTVPVRSDVARLNSMVDGVPYPPYENYIVGLHRPATLIEYVLPSRDGCL